MRPEEVHALAVAFGLTHTQAITATAIAWAESGLNPLAIGDESLVDETWGPSIGLYQVRSLRADAGTDKERDPERLTDPAFNTRSMVAISAGGTNWQPWSVYKNGKYWDYLDAVRAAVTEGEPIVAVVRGGKVLAHVQRFADAVSKSTGAESFGTYPGHDPSIERALDIFVPVNSATLGNAIAAFAIDNLERYGIWYLIYRQRIYNPKIADRWRDMEDRGSPTQNHFDHVHISFEATAAKLPADPPKPPDPKPQPEDDMATPHILLTYGSGVALWHASGEVITLASSKQVLDFLAQGALVMDDLTAEQVQQITGAKAALAVGPALSDVLQGEPLGCADEG